MTVNQARKILGKEANDLTDEELIHDLDTAELFKSLFFVRYDYDKAEKAENG